MNHWKRYIDKHQPGSLQLTPPMGWSAEMAVVIPCYNEPEMRDTLNALRLSAQPKARVMVLLVINSGECSPQQTILQNRRTYREAEQYADEYNSEGLRFFPLLLEGIPRKHAGVGLARKRGMDLAVAHFLCHEQRNGVIISLDADCTVSSNFLTSIHATFSNANRVNTTIHNFHHRTAYHDAALEDAARQYEAYIHYFSERLKLSGFPYYYHTIGSAFAVKADAYVRVGGMGRQQGGEDFYFLQKLFALGRVTELKETYVYPLARYSDRVPFGTGPMLQKIAKEPDAVLKVYSGDSFEVLRHLFDRIEMLYGDNIGSEEVLATLNGLDPSTVEYLKKSGFVDDVEECNRNSASLTTFRKRFFHHFNAFRIIQYLNHIHPDPFPLEKISSVMDKY